MNPNLSVGAVVGAAAYFMDRGHPDAIRNAVILAAVAYFVAGYMQSHSMGGAGGSW